MVIVVTRLSRNRATGKPRITRYFADDRADRARVAPHFSVAYEPPSRCGAPRWIARSSATMCDEPPVFRLNAHGTYARDLEHFKIVGLMKNGVLHREPPTLRPADDARSSNERIGAGKGVLHA